MRTRSAIWIVPKGIKFMDKQNISMYFGLTDMGMADTGKVRIKK